MITSICLTVAWTALCLTQYLLYRHNKKLLAEIHEGIAQHRAVQKELEEMLFSKLQKDGFTVSDRIVSFLIQLPGVQLRIAKDGVMTLCKREE